MGNHFSKYLFLFAIWGLAPIASISLFAQTYVLSNWTVEDGLSSNDVKDLFQDEDGFMWIATEHGLNKFNGYSFEKFRYNPGDSTSIGANYINNICADDKGNVWVNLAVGIVSKYNKRTKKFTNFSFPEENTFAFEIKFIKNIGLCISTNKGLFLADADAQELALFCPKDEDTPKSIFKIFPASNRRLFLSSSDGFEYLKFPSKSIEPIFFISKKDTVLFEWPIEKFHEDSDGTIWIQTKNGSLCKSIDGVYFKKSLSGTGESFTNPSGQLFIFEDDQNEKWLSNAYKLQTFNDKKESWNPWEKLTDEIFFAFLDREEKIWVCTKNHELLKWNGEKWESAIYLGDQLNYWEINHLFVDDKNGIWFSSRGKGIWRIFNRKWPINSLKSNNPEKPFDFPILALELDEAGFMWVGTVNNLYQYFFDTKELIPFFQNLQKNPISGLSVNDIAKNKNGELWLGLSNGVVIIEKNGSHRYFKTADENIPFGFVRNILSDQSGKTWIGSTNGLFLYDPETNRFYSYKPTEKGTIRSNDVQCLKQVSETEFLVGYTKVGVDLLTFDPSDHSISCKKVSYKNAKMVQFDLMTANTFYQSDGDYWVGTFSKGLLKLDLKSLTMSPLSEEFPIIPNVKGIQKGTKGNLWVSSIDGIRSVNPEDQTFYRFSKSSGLLSNRFYLNSDAQDQLGNLYFGSSHGVNKIQPALWNFEDTVTTPVLTDFKKFDESIVFETPLDEVEMVHLSHEDDYITFEFVSPTYDNSGDVQYAYQLEGLDKNWRYSEGQRSATYTNLAPGDYVFKVQAGNKGGFLNSKIKELKIMVSPPFWQSSWFIFLVIGFFGFSIWLVYKIQWKMRMNRLKIVAEVRKKAADDFHDELGHRLTKIVLFVESLMLQKNSFPSKATHILRKIQDNANELYYSTKDFIWAMNPSKDSALELFVLLRDFGDELFADTGIQFSVEGLKEEYKDYILEMDWKRQLIMIFKEAMNNVLKHSNGTAAVLKIEECKKHLKIVLEDNGEGFILNHEKFGYGLGSMVNRSRKIGGHLEINSQPGKGTAIQFTI